MDPLNNQPVPQQAPVTPSAVQAPEHKKVGPIVVILVVVLVLIIGALYIFASRMNQTPTDGSDGTATTESVQPVTNTSDDVSAIEADLDASIDGLDSQNF